jgi:hypothetical protein
VLDAEDDDAISCDPVAHDERVDHDKLSRLDSPRTSGRKQAQTVACLDELVPDVRRGVGSLDRYEFMD